MSFGTWPSPLSASLVASQGLRLGAVITDGDDVYWIEGRPAESGRNVLVRRRPDGQAADVTPPDFNVRTRVHEYGGGACVVSRAGIFATNFSDQRIYRITTGRGDAPAAAPVTPPGAWCYADLEVDVGRRRLVCVREDHTGGGHEPVNALVGIPLEAGGGEGRADVIASGHDFYSTPRLSPDGTRLAWLAWRHPQMPWDGTELWVAEVTAGGGLVDAARVAGGAEESIYQPGWSPDGRLYFVSDRSGWWQLYRATPAAGTAFGAEPVIGNAPADAEFGRPQWVFGTATWAFADAGRLVVSYTRGGRWHLAVVDVRTGLMTGVAQGLEPNEHLTATAAHAVLVAGTAGSADAVVRVPLDGGAIETIRRSSGGSSDAAVLPADTVSVAEPITFTTTGGAPAHAFFYAPRGAMPATTEGAPPLIVVSHGGPTTAARATLDLKIQYWTSRGFAVVDVNYGGSSGYGRSYRQRLDGQWGIADVADVIHAARHLVAQGRADPQRLIVRGGSAGGFTTLAALTTAPGVFAAGASYYGISDIEVLARDTHKFESRYLDGLIGPYPAMRERYRERSPIHHVDRLACALILLQGLEDRVVPPNQSAMMAEAVRASGWPVAYLTFAGEQHGFRRAETIVRSLEAELFFYGAVFGFTPADAIEPVPIDNLGTARRSEPPPQPPDTP